MTEVVSHLSEAWWPECYRTHLAKWRRYRYLQWQEVQDGTVFIWPELPDGTVTLVEQCSSMSRPISLKLRYV